MFDPKPTAFVQFDQVLHLAARSRHRSHRGGAVKKAQKGNNADVPQRALKRPQADQRSNGKSMSSVMAGVALS
jgi:hypothetical protein